MKNILESEAWWSEAWVRHIEQYLTAPPRTGIWLDYRFNLKSKVILECAGGSCRDSRYLFEKGVDAIGSDFDIRTLSYLRKRYPECKQELRQINAFDMNVNDDSFDIVFHNGFWILFTESEKIDLLLKEQIRVSKNHLVIIVHNKSNKTLVQSYSKKATKDKLYNITFFDKNMLINSIKGYQDQFSYVTFEKFGGPIDRLYNLVRRYPILRKVIYWLVPRLYKLQPWSRVERVAMVIKLK